MQPKGKNRERKCKYCDSTELVPEVSGRFYNFWRCTKCKRTTMITRREDGDVQ